MLRAAAHCAGALGRARRGRHQQDRDKRQAAASGRRSRRSVAHGVRSRRLDVRGIGPLFSRSRLTRKANRRAAAAQRRACNRESPAAHASGESGTDLSPPPHTLSSQQPPMSRHFADQDRPGIADATCPQRMQAVQQPIIPVVGELIRRHPGTISLGQGVVHYGPPPRSHRPHRPLSRRSAKPQVQSRSKAFPSWSQALETEAGRRKRHRRWPRTAASWSRPAATWRSSTPCWPSPIRATRSSC